MDTHGDPSLHASQQDGANEGHMIYLEECEV